MQNMQTFDYAKPAELYAVNCGHGRPKQMIYRRFANVASAIRFVIEELSPAQRRGSVIEVNEMRHYYREICALYERNDYPLRKPTAKARHGNEAKLQVRALGALQGEGAKKSGKAPSQA